MKTDLYTKIVLTVIALSLAVIVIRDLPLVGIADASSGPDTKYHNGYRGLAVYCLNCR